MRFKNCLIATVVILSLFHTNVSANIDGILIETIEAQRYGQVHIPLISKRVKTNKDMFHLGYLISSKSTKALIKEDEFYIITMQDKFSKGKLSAIIKGSYLQKYQYHISALTQVSFLLSQEYIGRKYDKIALENNLNNIARKMVKRKGFVLDNDFEIGYTDVLLYENGGRELYKSYDDHVRPLERKIKNNTLTREDAYDFVYEKSSHKRVLTQKIDEPKKVKPLYRLVVFLHIPRNTKRGTEIVKLKRLREGSAKVDGFELNNSNVPFRISSDGSVVLSAVLREDVYDFEAVAHTKDGDSNKISFTIVVDNVKEGKYYKLK